MSRGSEAKAALKAECEAAIEDIKNHGGRSDCKAHGPIARGQITLLRCEIARLASDCNPAKTLEKMKAAMTTG